MSTARESARAAGGSRWAEALDTVERRVAEAEALLDGGGGTAPGEFDAPDGLGPLPPELVARAEALLARSRDVEAGLARRLEARPRLAARPRFNRSVPVDRSRRLDAGL